MSLKTNFEEAYKNGFALGGFNFFNHETAFSVAKAASLAKKSAILMVSEKSVDYYGLESLVYAFNKAKEITKADIYLHLDHGTDLALIREALKMGFDSIMFDGSRLPLDQNIELSRELRRETHKRGKLFEAEIGCVGGKEDYTRSQNFKTNPSEALIFVEKVKPDILAVAIGNIHGEKTTEEQLDFTLLAKIQDTVEIPLVLHGCSNRSDREYQVAISEGVAKINIDTELRQAFVEGLKKSIHRKESDPREIMKTASDNVAVKVKQKIELFAGGCCHR